LQLRRELGLLPQVRETLVVPDLDGKRISSGGTTLYCLAQVMANVRQTLPSAKPALDAAAVFRRLRILIVHAGGDSRRLPAYGPCGKIFVPIPGSADAALPPALFDLLVPSFLALPEGRAGCGCMRPKPPPLRRSRRTLPRAVTAPPKSPGWAINPPFHQRRLAIWKVGSGSAWHWARLGELKQS
jgi:hypothetical protein